MTVRLVLFDVGGTLLGKPDVPVRIAALLAGRGTSVPPETIARQLRELAEVRHAPPETTREFYLGFNAELLRRLGVPADAALTQDVFDACRGLPWKPFADVDALPRIGCRLGIASNWDHRLRALLASTVRAHFEPIVVSGEETGLAKPDPAFYETALRRAGVRAGETIHVGDSLSLDVGPATAAGIHAVLLDRGDDHPGHAGARVRSLRELPELLRSMQDDPSSGR